MTTPSATRNLLRFAAFSVVLGLGAMCVRAQQPSDNGPDPALANMAPADAAAAQQPDQSTVAPDGSAYPQQSAAPIVRSAPAPDSSQPDDQMQPGDQAQGGDSYNAPSASDQVADGQQALDDADASTAQAPPPLPDYDQPPAPGDNYMWTPGYWGFGPGGYYWVPGAWAVPPYYGGLWTPGYWGWYGGRYFWHPGYWGLHVGFYGGVNYGFGYIGTGYFGGYWQGNNFFYNRAVTNVGPRVGYVYNRTVVYNNRTYGARPANRVSFNGGRGGIQVAPRPDERIAMRQTRTAPLAGQVQLRRNAAANPAASFNANHGRPAVTTQQSPITNNRPIANSQREFKPQPQNQPRPQPQQARPNAQPRQQARPKESHSDSKGRGR